MTSTSQCGREGAFGMLIHCRHCHADTMTSIFSYAATVFPVFSFCSENTTQQDRVCPLCTGRIVVLAMGIYMPSSFLHQFEQQSNRFVCPQQWCNKPKLIGYMTWHHSSTDPWIDWIRHLGRNLLPPKLMKAKTKSSGRSGKIVLFGGCSPKPYLSQGCCCFCLFIEGLKCMQL